MQRGPGRERWTSVDSKDYDDEASRAFMHHAACLMSRLTQELSEIAQKWAAPKKRRHPLPWKVTEEAYRAAMRGLNITLGERSDRGLGPQRRKL